MFCRQANSMTPNYAGCLCIYMVYANNQCSSFLFYNTALYKVLKEKRNAYLLKLACLVGFSGRTVRHAGSEFPDQAWNLCPLQGKHGILTTRLTFKKERSFLSFKVKGHMLRKAEMSWLKWSKGQITRSSCNEFPITLLENTAWKHTG